MRTRLYVAGILGGLAVLVVAVVVVFAFGRHDPSPPRLSEEPRPEIPGEILFVDNEYCFVRMAASGETRSKLACMPQYFGGQALYWIDDNTAGVVQYEQRGQVLWHVDLRTGVMTDTGIVLASNEKPPQPGIYGGAYAPDETYGYVDEKGDLYILVAGERTKVANFDTHDYQQPRVTLWSPDSQWMVLQYYPPRSSGSTELWIVSRDGATQGTLATTSSPSSAAWRIGTESTPELPE